MLQEFIRIVQSLFPSIDPYTAANCLGALKQHKLTPKQFYSPKLLENISQGDILSPIKFNILGEGTRFYEHEGVGLLISNTCDAENDENVLIAVALPWKEIESAFSFHSLTQIKQNLLFNFMYLPEVHELGSLVIDFARVQSVQTDYLKDSVRNNNISRYASLSQFGFYLLISKLTIHFLRPEPIEVGRN